MTAHLSPEQLEQALDLQRKCYTHERIATQLGFHRTTVTRSLARHNAAAFRLLEKQTAALKAKQIAQLEWMAEEAAIQWERSTENAESIRTTRDTGNPGADERTVEISTDQTGNPALLREARESLAAVRALLGIDAKLDLDREKLDRLTQPDEHADDDFEVDLTPDDPEDPAQQADDPPA